MRALAPLLAMVRLARRDAWRNLGRSSLIALMVALPVMAASSVSVIARSVHADARDHLVLDLGPGPQALVRRADRAPIRLAQDVVGGTSYSEPPERRPADLTDEQFESRLRAVLPGGDTLVRQVGRAARPVAVGARAGLADLAEFDYGAGLRGPQQRISGRDPATANEVVVSRALSHHLGVRVGEVMSVDVGSREPMDYSVVGVVGGPGLAGTDRVFARPGALRLSEAPPTDRESSWFVVGPEPVRWVDVQKVNGFGGVVLSRAVVQSPPPLAPPEVSGSLDSTAIAVVAVIAALVLLQVALMAGPAVAVGARRNERTLALVAAAGGRRRDQRAAVLASSGLVGLVASLAGAVGGAVLAAALVPVLRSRWDQPIAGLDIRPLDLAALVVVGTCTAVVAALLPARRVARLDVVDTLTGRRVTAKPRLGGPVAGALMAAAGLGLAWYQSGRGSVPLAVLGLGLVDVGLVAAAPAVVGLSGRAVAGASFLPRFALRDAARQRSRTAPAVAAVLAAVAGGMTAILFLSGASLADRSGYDSDTPPGSVTVEVPVAEALGPAETALRGRLPVRDVTTVQGSSGADVSLAGRCVRFRDGSSACAFLTPKFVPATAGAVFAPDRSGAVTAALAAGRVVVFDPTVLTRVGTVEVTVSRQTTDGYTEAPPIRLPAVYVPTGPRLSAPLVPVSLASRLAVTLGRADLVASTTRVPSVAEQDRAAAALQRSGLSRSIRVERGYQRDFSAATRFYLGIALLVALIGTAAAVGLASAEARPDLATLAAVGASPGLRRRLGAAQAAAIALPGTLLGLLAGAAGGWVMIRLNAHLDSADLSNETWRLVMPWSQVALLGLGIPVATTALGFALVRSRLPLPRRRGQ